jgi:hypothetical protein
MKDGYKAVINHHSQNKIAQNPKTEKVHLGDAACVGNGLVVCLDVHQHLWDSGVSETHAEKDTPERKKYMGVCMWESEMVARMMIRLPKCLPGIVTGKFQKE